MEDAGETAHVGEMAHVEKTVRLYLSIFAGLLLLTIVTVWASSWETATATGVVVALAIAATKGTLVAGFFMHLFSDRFPLIARVLVFAAVFFVVLVGLVLLGFLDTFGARAGDLGA
jgi:cytochrome c oxidase subunit 4